MKSSRFRRRAGWFLVGCSLLLHVFTVYAFGRQPELLAAYTVMPIWLWGGIGLCFSMIAFWFLRAPLSLWVTGVWAITILIGADEARILTTNINKSRPEPGQAGLADGKPLLRVLTLNCNYFNYDGGNDPAIDIQRWDPDIVLLQEVQPFQVKHVADRLYHGHGDYRTFLSNGIVTRWRISREVRNQLYRDQQVTVAKPDGTFIEVVNVHLQTAATDLRLWDPGCWQEHSVSRNIRATELWHTLQVLADTAPGRPSIVGGDFNAPPSDPIQSLLKGDFEDAFVQAGSGWGNTYQRRIPILRIDQIHASRQLRPLRCAAVTTRRSDHRMVVADFLTVP
ncbi:endonuclease/exonuclease/phosphatase family protein [Luteolibacter sp. Populi]|uniref:endonuclease/exonuclease/phosphatase family protein n=1 Tax=Luteolibacter sp. Populi TaxID=3230487 RepID=UPI003467157D